MRDQHIKKTKQAGIVKDSLVQKLGPCVLFGACKRDRREEKHQRLTKESELWLCAAHGTLLQYVCGLEFMSRVNKTTDER